MAKITKREKSDRETIVVKTKSKPDGNASHKWWKGSSKSERGAQLVETAAFLKEQLQFRYRQASIFSRSRLKLSQSVLLMLFGRVSASY